MSRFHTIRTRLQQVLAQVRGSSVGQTRAMLPPCILDGRATAVGIETLAGASLLLAVDVDPRTVVSEAIGRSMTGERVSVFLDGPGVMQVLDLVRQVAACGLPIVFHVEASSADARASETSHEAIHALADTGVFLLVARHSQDVVDLTLVARRVAELTLVPAVVAMDASQTATALQDVRFPTDDCLLDIVGRSDDLLTTPTQAQRFLFGEHRRRVPRWFDLDHPMQQGAVQRGVSWGNAVAARRPFFLEPVSVVLDEALEKLRTVTGSTLGLTSPANVDDADIVLIGQGAAVEIAKAAIDAARRVSKSKVGLVSLQCLRPFPTLELARILAGKRQVIVLERDDAPLASHTPLLREVRTAVGANTERLHDGRGKRRRGHEDTPLFRAAVAGMGGLPLRVADLIALCEQTAEDERPLVYLGVQYDTDSRWPKRQVHVDRIRRACPEIAALGVRAKVQQNAADSTAESITIGILRSTPAPTTDWLQNLATLLVQTFGGHIRSRLDVPSLHIPGAWVDRVSWSANHPVDCSDEEGLDVVIIGDASVSARPEWLAELHVGASVLFVTKDREITAAEHSLRAFVLDRKLPASWHDPRTGAGAFVLAAATKLLVERMPTDKEEPLLKKTYKAQLASLSESVQRLCLEEFEAGLAALRPLNLLVPEKQGGPPDRVEHETPRVLRDMQRMDALLDSLPRFRDQVGVLYENGHLSELTPDPYLATGAMPPMSAAFRRHYRGLETLPRIQPSLCTGCGMCWSSCPDGAIGATTVTPGALLDAAMRAAQDSGHAVAPLRMLQGKIVSRVAEEMTTETPPAVAGKAIRRAFEAVASQSRLPESRRQEIEAAASAVALAVEDLPLIRCKPMFEQAEAEIPGSGELLSLVINANFCKECGICIAVCEPGAITATSRTPQVLATAEREDRLHSLLPDAGATAVERLRRFPDVGAMPAAMLSQRSSRTIVGGDDAEPGCGARIAVRQILACIDQEQRPLLQEQVVSVSELQKQLSERIRGMLAEALPTQDLDALAAGLQSLESIDVDLSALAARVEQSTQSGHVDAGRLAALVEAARKLADLHWRLESGVNGVGRAPLGLVVIAGLTTDWAVSFPDNPFGVPAVTSTAGDGIALAKGVLAGERARALQDIQLQRYARLLLERPAEAMLLAADIKGLRWDELADQERRFCAPIVLLADEKSWTRSGADLVSLSDADAPVKLVLLTELDGVGPGSEAAGPAVRALLQRDVFVLQSSIAFPEHLATGLAAAMRFEGPAVIRVHAPSPRRHGFASDATLRQAQRAVEARALPLFRREPSVSGDLGRLLLESNPEPTLPWSCDATGSPFTYADWAQTERRFATSFNVLPSDAARTAPIAEFVADAAYSEKSDMPILALRNGSLPRMQVAPAMVRATRQHLEVWEMLRALAGLAAVEAKDEEPGAAADVEHWKTEREVLEREHQSQLAALRNQVEQEMLGRLERQLQLLAEQGGLLDVAMGGVSKKGGLS